MKVSAIMVTADRQEFATGAIEQFLAQTWQDKELVIVDSGVVPLKGIPLHLDIVYIWLSPRTIGVLRNCACALATGEAICHWDDDDIYAPDRIEDQAKRLIESGVDFTAYYEMEFVHSDGRRWMYKGKPWAPLGVSFMYRKTLWRRNPFPDMMTGEDNAFLKKAKPLSVPANGRIIARIHEGNTCQKMKLIETATPGQWVPLPT